MKKISLAIEILMGVFVATTSFAAPPTAPTGLCLQTLEGAQCATDTSSDSTGEQSGVFPGTNLKFYPGFVIASSEGESPSSINSRWNALFTASPNRKASYRPSGIYGGVTIRLAWSAFYKNQSVKPTNPTNHADAAYDWSKLDAVFAINAVQNEGALVSIEIGDISYSTTPKAPSWLVNAPYNGILTAGTDGGSGQQKAIPKYYRYSSPDLRGVSTDKTYPIVEEWVNFHHALRDHLIATGNINKVMMVGAGGEVYLGSNFVPPTDWNLTNFRHGVALRSRLVAQIWAQSNIFANAGSLTGDQKTVSWPYLQAPPVGMGYPDVKLDDTGNFGANTRFSDPNGRYQKDERIIVQATEGNGQRATTYFAPGTPNPWGYSGVSVPQTASHILWALSGAPRGTNKDSGLGQAGEDPSGVLPVHVIVIDFNRSWQANSPDVSEWQEAIDTFGPPGTRAFPYLPPEYKP